MASDLYNEIDYWIPQVVVTRLPRVDFEGHLVEATVVKTVWHPSFAARTLRMLAHFRALDRDDD